MTTAGRKSATSSALTHSGECVRSYTSTVSAITASQVPRPETVVARKSSPEGRRAIEELELAPRTGQHGGKTVPGPGDAAPSRERRSARNASSSGVPTLTRIAVGCAEAVGRPDDRALAQQRAPKRPRVLAQLDEDEVGYRARRRLEPARRAARLPAPCAPRRSARAGGAARPASPRLASAASCAGVDTSKARRTCRSR